MTFQPGPDGVGTEVRLLMQFEPPLGNAGSRPGEGAAHVPRGIAGQTLRRFKSRVETGEIPTLEHNRSGRGARTRLRSDNESTLLERVNDLRVETVPDT